MILTDTQILDYNQNGYLLIEHVFSTQEVNALLTEMQHVIEEDCPRRILEKTGAVRSFFAPEWGSNLFENLITQERLVIPSKQLIGTEIYKHQTKLNTKHALFGDWWEWHQDYIFWQKEDGMPRPEVLTAMVFLNEVTEFNGPLVVIPGSHKQGMLDVAANAVLNEDNEYADYQQSTSYMTSLTTDLKYTIKERELAAMINRNGLFSAKGPAGSVLFFHGNLFHASANNLSPWNRHTFLVTYNSLDNTLPDIENPRPEFISSRDFTPIG